MSWDDYWDGEPVMLEVYYKKYIFDNKLKAVEQDNTAWMIGSYVTSAISSVLGAMYAKKGTPATSLPQYPKEPQFTKDLLLTDEQRKQKELRLQEERVRQSYINICKVVNARKLNAIEGAD